MPILRKLKSLLGVDDGEDDAERDVTVTVEHNPANEAAVKGADVEDSTSGGDGDDTTVATASQADSVATESTTEESEDDADDAAAESDEADETPDETPDEVEIPDAEEPADETEEESANDAAEESADESEVENAEEDYEVDAESDDSGVSEPVDVLTGIGSAYAQRLGDAGVDTVADLATADAAELSDATDIAQGRIEGWIDQANEY